MIASRIGSFCSVVSASRSAGHLHHTARQPVTMTYAMGARNGAGSIRTCQDGEALVAQEACLHIPAPCGRTARSGSSIGRDSGHGMLLHQAERLFGFRRDELLGHDIARAERRNWKTSSVHWADCSAAPGDSA